MSHAIVFLMPLLLLAILAEPLAKKACLPFGVVLIGIGFVSSEIVVKQFGMDTGIRWHNVGDIVFHIILPVLIFKAALTIDIKLLRTNIIALGLLSLPLMLVSVFIIATCLFYGLDHAGFPWIAALITGALLSAPEPSVVLPILKQNNIPEKLGVLLESESLFNDATAVALFTMFIVTATHMGTGDQLDINVTRFIILFFSSLAFGIVSGFLTCLVIKLTSACHLLPLSSIICAYLTFIIAGDILHLSGVMAVLSSGLVVGAFTRRSFSKMEYDFNTKLWNFLSHVAESLIFLLAGITITLSMFTDRWLAISLAIIATIIARIVIIFGTFPLLNVLPNVEAVPTKHQAILVWGGGIRGVLTLTLALSLPLTLDYWYTIQSIAYGVVLFTLFVQATTISPLMHRFNRI